MTSYLYRVLPRDIASDFGRIDHELRHRGVRAAWCTTRSGGRIYRVAVEDIDRLPNNNGPRLGDETVGWPLGKMPDVARARAELGAGEWNEVET